MFFLNRLLSPRKTRRDYEIAYLNESVSHYDLECRERDIARGKFAGF